MIVLIANTVAICRKSSLLSGVFALLLATSIAAEARAEYGVFYSLCASPTWKVVGYVPGGQNNAATYAAQLNRQYAGTFKFAVGQMTTQGQVTRWPTESARCSSGGGSGGGGAGGGGAGGGGCYGQIDNPFFVIAKQVNGSWAIYQNKYFCGRTKATAEYNANYIALRNAGYTIVSGSFRWNSCGPKYYRCQNGYVVTAPNYSSSGRWATN